jgi:plastocyanin
MAAMKRLALALGVLCAAVSGAWLAAPAQGQHVPALVYTRVIPAQAADFKWSDAKKGSVKGKLTFSARRASAPIVVYMLRDGGEGKFDVPAALNVSQEGAKFEPNFAVLVRGQKAEFLNDEKKEISHNVYFLGAAELDLGIFAKGEKAAHEFPQAGEISMHCSFHKNMDGKLFIAPSPAFATVESDKEEFTISGVPAGKYKLKTWQKQKRFKDVEIDVTVEADKSTAVTVEMAR